MFENNVLRKMEGYKIGKVRGNCRKVHEECHDLYSSPNIIWVIIQWIVRQAEHKACMGEKRLHTGFWHGNMKESDSSEDLGT